MNQPTNTPPFVTTEITSQPECWTTVLAADQPRNLTRAVILDQGGAAS
jgi:hypothetical protein